MPHINTPHKGACHCGSVQFEVTPVDGLNNAFRCNCSMCRMRGAVIVAANVKDLKVTKGEDKLTLYQFNTNIAKHYFCSVCGIYTHHQRRLKPQEYAVNVACLEGVSPFDFEEVLVVNGASHPLDTGGGPALQTAGVLRFNKG